MEIYATDVIWIEIKGDVRPEQKEVLMTRDDKGLISELYDFMKQEAIIPFYTLMSGGGMYSALFKPEDGEKIKKWLEIREL